ncbi:MAG: fibronectin type III domain-containing protein [Patescibacteria group bacterium]
MNRYSFALFASVLSLGLFAAVPQTSHAAVIFSDDVENGENGWTPSGLWHVQTNPEDISISSDFNPDLVSLPDDGSLPEANSGNTIWWYGAEDDGTFMGDYDDTTQWDDNGGWSDEANSGDLVSPEIDLTEVETARLSFWTWWEIEGVDVDRYDLMQVEISTDGGEIFTDLGAGQINPINDVNGEFWKPYSSGGLGQVGVWERHVFNLSDYAGETVVLKFTFDTVDEKYNAFRGWLLDDIIVDDQGLKAPKWAYLVRATRSCSGGEEVQTPQTFYLPKKQTVSVTKSKDAFAYITRFGTNDWVWDSSVGRRVALPSGTYVVWVDFKGNRGCPHVQIRANVAIKAGPQVEAIQPDAVLVINGSNYVSGAEVKFNSAGSTQALDVTSAVEADEVSVVSSSEVHVVVPASLEKGTYNVTITNPDGQAKTMKKAIDITKADAPDVSLIDPTSVDNSAAETLTIYGTGFESGALVVVGGVPLSDVTVDDSGVTITGTLPAGATPGFQNVEIINPDGQDDVLVGGLEIEDGGGAPFIPDGDFVGEPDKVLGVLANVTGETTATITWDVADRATSYRVQLRDSEGNRIKTFKASTESRNIGNIFLDAGESYKVKVRGVNSYGKGDWSAVVEFIQ